MPDEELYGWLNFAWSTLGKLSRGEDVAPADVQQARYFVSRAKLRTSALVERLDRLEKAAE